MAEQQVTYARSIDDTVVVKAAGRVGWVTALLLQRDGAKLFLVDTTEADGRPKQLWLREGDMADVTESTS